MKNKKNIFIIIIALVLVVGVGYYAMSDRSTEKELVGVAPSQEKEEQEDISKEDDIIISDDKEEVIEDNEISYDIETGKLAPNFTLENLDGEEVSLADYKGKIVMLNFWATWCPHCVREMPDMNRIQEENDDLVILAVNVQEEKGKVKNYIDEGGYDFEVVLDPKGDVARTYLISAFPTSYFIDKEGILLGGVPGMLEYPQMKQLIEGIRKNE